jgi:putative spermidine/putrescine transport system substrate-binding protein
LLKQAHGPEREGALHQICRRQLIRLAAALPAATVLGNRRSIAQSIPTIKATHFGGPYTLLQKAVAEPLAKNQIANVIYEVENSGTALAKMQAQKGNPPFNVALLTRGVAIRASNIGLIEHLGAGDINDLGQLTEGALAPNGVGVAMVLDSIDIMYDRNRVSKPIESWLDLWRPEFKGKLLMPALPLPMAHLIVIITARALGGSEKDDKWIGEAFSKLKELKPNIRTFYRDPVQANQLIERGEAVACPQYSIRISNAMKANATLTRATPKEGVPVTAYDLTLLKDSLNQDIAKKYINFCLSAPVQQLLANGLLATMANKVAKIEPQNEQYVMNDYSRLWFFDEIYVAMKQREWFDRWTREIES